jgi:hypothetical protein
LDVGVVDGEPLGKAVLGDIDGSKEEIEILFGSFVVIGDGVIGAPVIGASVIIIGCMDATI